MKTFADEFSTVGQLQPQKATTGVSSDLGDFKDCDRATFILNVGTVAGGNATATLEVSGSDEEGTELETLISVDTPITKSDQVIILEVSAATGLKRYMEMDLTDVTGTFNVGGTLLGARHSELPAAQFDVSKVIHYEA